MAVAVATLNLYRFSSALLKISGGLSARQFKLNWKLFLYFLSTGFIIRYIRYSATNIQQLGGSNISTLLRFEISILHFEKVNMISRLTNLQFCIRKRWIMVAMKALKTRMTASIKVKLIKSCEQTIID